MELDGYFNINSTAFELYAGKRQTKVNVSIYYNDGQYFSANVIIKGDYPPSYKEIFEEVKKYFKGNLMWKD